MHWVLILCLALNLADIKTEPNLERRSQMALDHAKTALDRARDAWNGGDGAAALAAMTETGDSVDLAYQSLEESAKGSHRNARLYKRAELATRDLLRRISGLRDTVSIDDRAAVETVRDRIAKIHDDLLDDLLSKKDK